MSLSEANPPIEARTGVDSVWARLRVEAAAAAAEEPILASFLNAAILRHDEFSHALAYRLSAKLADAQLEVTDIDTLVGQTPDRFSLTGEICKPELFTIGLIPGLQELERTSFKLTYDNRQASIEGKLHLPHIRWADIVLDSIALEAAFGPDQFGYDLLVVLTLSTYPLTIITLFNSNEFLKSKNRHVPGHSRGTP